MVGSSMAYRRRRRGLGFWPRAIFALLIAVSLLFLFRHRLETRLTALADPVVTAMPALLDGGSTRAAAAPIPTFTITIERPIPLADVPAPEAAAQQYLTAWSSGDYAAMYDTLSQSSRSGQSEKEFVERYQQLTAEASITKVTPKITSVPMVPEKAGNGASVQVPFTVEFRTIRAGDFTENNSVSLVLEDGRWRVD